MTEVAQVVRILSGVGEVSASTLEEATVVSVDELNRTCITESVSAKGPFKRTDVRLMTDVDDGFLLVPAVGSSVIICRSDTVSPFVCYFSELESVTTTVGDNQMRIDANGIRLNKGDFEGLVKVVPLTERINKLETAYNELQAKFNAHVHTGVTTGAGSSGTTPSISTSSVDNTQQAYIENKTVKHGGSI